jgi:hypothetical protein
MRPKLQKQSALKLAGQIIPLCGGYNLPQLTLGDYTRDLLLIYNMRIDLRQWVIWVTSRNKSRKKQGNIINNSMMKTSSLEECEA